MFRMNRELSRVTRYKINILKIKYIFIFHQKQIENKIIKTCPIAKCI